MRFSPASQTLSALRVKRAVSCSYVRFRTSKNALTRRCLFDRAGPRSPPSKRQHCYNKHPHPRTKSPHSHAAISVVLPGLKTWTCMPNPSNGAQQVNEVPKLMRRGRRDIPAGAAPAPTPAPAPAPARHKPVHQHGDRGQPHGASQNIRAGAEWYAQ